MRDQSRARHAALIPHEQVREAVATRQLAEQRLHTLVSHPSEGGYNLPASDRRVVAAEHDVEEATSALERINRLNEKYTAAWR